MANHRSPDPGGPVIVEGSTHSNGDEEPNRIGRFLESPARLKDRDFLEAVTLAVARELEGGVTSLPDLRESFGGTMGIVPRMPDSVR
jgi:hypothetical protein